MAERTGTIAFSGRVAVVTGGASGMGLASARRLKASGATVVIWDLDGPAMTAAGEEFGADACMVVDVSQAIEPEAAAAAVAAKHGRLDILVHCAGIVGDFGPSDALPVESWDRVIRINLSGSFYVSRAVLPQMKAQGYGRIVLIASAGAKDGHPFMAAYVTSKGGVITLAKTLGKEVARHGILVNCIAPGVIDTPMMAASDMDQQARNRLVEAIPVGRIGQPEEVAAMIHWLVSEECSYSSGAVFDLSGGRTNY